jgi:formylmethanofuran dehydrogenase subunit D
VEKVIVILNSGRTSQQGVGLEVGKTSDEYFKSVSYIELSPEDADSLSIEEGDNVKVETKFGSVVVSTKVFQKLNKGESFFPYGIWANQVIGTDTECTGMPSYKGIEAKITVTKKKVPSLTDLVAKIKGGPL